MKRSLWTVVSTVALLAAAAPAAATIATVVVEARDLERLARFYSQDLGLPVLSGGADTGRLVLDAAGTQFVILRGERGGDGRQGCVRLLLPTADLDGVRLKLESMKLPFREVVAPDSTRQGFFFEDPEGNPIGYVLETAAPAAWLVPPAIRGKSVLREGSGRTALMVYGGLYGIWLGVALPAGLGADSEIAFGLSLIAGGPLGVASAYYYGTKTGVTSGRAAAISLAGNFATWQGLGWAALGDVEGEEILLSGAAAGLTGIVTSAALVRSSDITSGQATVLHSATSWATWYGFVGSRFADASGEKVLGSMLVTSGAGLAAATLWSRHHDMSASRARLISLGGVLGTVMGWGADLVGGVDTSPGYLVPPTIGGLAGLVSVAYLTRERSGPDFGARQQLNLPPLFALGPHGGYRLTLLHARF